MLWDPQHATDIARCQQNIRDTGNLGHRRAHDRPKIFRLKSRSETHVIRKSQTNYSKCLSYFKYHLLNRSSNFTKASSTSAIQDATFAFYPRFRSRKSTVIYSLLWKPSAMHVLSQWSAKHPTSTNETTKRASERTQVSVHSSMVILLCDITKENFIALTG